MNAPVPGAARPYQGRPAGVVTRCAAAVLDAVVVSVILFAGYGMLAGLVFMVNPLEFRFPRPSRLINLSTALAVTALYLMLAWTFSGRTYGMLVLGLRVVGPDGRGLRLVAALVRAVLCLIFPIGLLWSAVNGRNRSVQDVLLRTSVVYDWRNPTFSTVNSAR